MNTTGKIYREEKISKGEITTNIEEISIEGKKVFIRTFGCQMNEKDSERMIAKLGMIPAQSEEEADVIIVNTCAVREKPEHKVYSEVGRYIKLKKVKKDLKVGITGCVAQLKGSELLEKTDADFVVGTHAINRIDQIVKRVIAGEIVVDTSLTTNLNDRFESPIPETFYDGSRIKAFVTIQEGCNQFCTFCIVPITRGREVTRPSHDIIREIIELSSRGVKEVTLIGQNVNGYGWNTPGEISFAQLLREINKIDGILRIIEHYLEIIGKLKKKIPSIALTTDVIVGFPGETDEDFEETVKLIKEVKFDDIFSFKFSPRPGTAAARIENQIPEEVKAERLKYIQSIQDEITLNKMREYIGKIEEILVEGPAQRNPEKDSTGRTRTGKPVNFEGKIKPGEIVFVKITEAFRNSLRGEIVN
jgi:tRNA-2-methylthio-N6-dimethylallyladenosine synthase